MHVELVFSLTFKEEKRNPIIMVDLHALSFRQLVIQIIFLG